MFCDEYGHILVPLGQVMFEEGKKVKTTLVCEVCGKKELIDLGNSYDPDKYLNIIQDILEKNREYRLIYAEKFSN